MGKKNTPWIVFQGLSGPHLDAAVNPDYLSGDEGRIGGNQKFHSSGNFDGLTVTVECAFGLFS